MKYSSDRIMNENPVDGESSSINRSIDTSAWKHFVDISMSISDIISFRLDFMTNPRQK